MKFVFRYLVAVIMIPVGVALGGLGVIQNYLRRERYNKRFREITAGFPQVRSPAAPEDKSP